MRTRSSTRILLLLLGTAGVVIPLFHRLRISPVIGYLIAGILIGPYGIGRLAGDAPWPAAFSISDTSSITFVGELGVVMLLFMIGLELSPARLYTLRRLVFLLGSAQLVLSAGLLGLAAYLLGMEPTYAAVVGLALALSSTAIVVELLSADKRLGTQVGRATFSILLLQDLAFVAILLFIGSLGRSGGADNVFVGIMLALLQAVITVIAIMVLGRFALRPFLRLAAEAGGADLFLASIMFIVAATALLSKAAGLSTGFGAFVAGLLIAETEFRREAESLIDPLRRLLLGIFFISVTMTINPATLIQQPVLVFAAVLGMIAVKAAVVMLVGPLLGSVGRRSSKRRCSPVQAASSIRGPRCCSRTRRRAARDRQPRHPGHCRQHGRSALDLGRGSAVEQAHGGGDSFLREPRRSRRSMTASGC